MATTKVIAFAHQKGGVGKTVMCNIFAQELCKQGNKVCLIDTDKQESIHLEYLVKKDAGIEPDVPVLNLKTFAEVSSFIQQNHAEYNYIMIDLTGIINDDNIKILKHCDSIFIPITAGQTDWTSFQTFAKTLNSITDNDQMIIGILNKYKPHTNRWKQFLPVVKEYSESHNILIPKMQDIYSDTLVPAQLRDREDYTNLIMGPLTDEKINRYTKYEIIHLIDSIIKYIR
ncbi:MAG: ParA family protein [Bacteroidales bacterium]